MWQKVDHEHISLISGDHVRSAIVPKTSALSLAAARRKAATGEHMSTATFCGPLPPVPPAMKQLHWGYHHVHLSEVLSESINGPYVCKLVYMLMYTDWLKGKFSYTLFL